jgi:hypothetical protein
MIEADPRDISHPYARLTYPQYDPTWRGSGPHSSVQLVLWAPGDHAMLEASFRLFAASYLPIRGHLRVGVSSTGLHCFGRASVPSSKAETKLNTEAAH